MADFDAVIEAQLAGANVRSSPIVRFKFKSGTKRYWYGFGDLRAGGELWEGTAGVGVVSEVLTSVSGGVDEMTFSVAGTEAILERIAEDKEESIGREVEVLLQFFDIRQEDDDGNWVDWAVLSDPFSFFVGKMGPLTTQMTPPEEGSARSRIVSVRAQNIFVNRARPNFSFFSDRDQKARDPTATDNIFVNVARYAEGTVRWPQF